MKDCDTKGAIKDSRAKGDEAHSFRSRVDSLRHDHDCRAALVWRGQQRARTACLRLHCTACVVAVAVSVARDFLLLVLCVISCPLLAPGANSIHLLTIPLITVHPNTAPPRHGAELATCQLQQQQPPSTLRVTLTCTGSTKTASRRTMRAA